MTLSAELLDLQGAEAIGPSLDPWGERARRFAIGVMRQGVSSLVENASADACLLRVGEHLIPVLVPSAELDMRSATDLVSPWTHYVGYSREEIGKRHPDIPPPLLDAAFAPLELVFRLGRGQSVVYLNNWLMATNPMTEFSPEEIQAATRALVGRYSDRAVVVRSVNPELNPRLVSALRSAGYRLVRSRRVYVLDPRDGAYLRKRDIRSDLSLRRRTDYKVVEDAAALAAQADRLVELYRSLYLDRHSRLNAHCTERFFRLTLEQGLIEYRGLAKAGRLDAFVGWHLRDGTLTSAILGHDCSKPRELGLYRQVTAMLIAEADRLGVRLNLSGGVERFKRQRGAVASEEYEAIYDRHLAVPRRALWRLLAAIGWVAARRTSET